MTEEQRPIPRPIAEAAAAWIVRRDAGPLSATDAAAFRRWLAEPTHRAALHRLEAVWGVLEAQPAAVPPSPSRGALHVPVLRVPRRWRGLTASAVAASLTLVIVGSVEDWPTRLRADYRTDIGERRTARLPDGSTAQLDGRSAITLHFSSRQRDVELLGGTALFNVAADRRRPFVVTANGGSITALGTAFMVRDTAAGTDVTVTLHRVRVAAASRVIDVGAGQAASYADDTLRGPSIADPAATAWTRGLLVAANRPLADVVAEIARHHQGYIAVTGSAAALRVSGVYDLDHPVATIDGIERSLALRSFRLTDRIIILRR